MLHFIIELGSQKLLDFHKMHGKIGTVTGVRPPSRFGELLVDQHKAVHFSEKPQTSAGLISGGFFVFKREIFDYLSEDENCDFEKGPLEKLSRDNELMVYEHKGKWMCMDTLRDMDYLNKLWHNGECFWKIWE